MQCSLECPPILNRSCACQWQQKFLPPSWQRAAPSTWYNACQTRSTVLGSSSQMAVVAELRMPKISQLLEPRCVDLPRGGHAKVQVGEVWDL